MIEKPVLVTTTINFNSCYCGRRLKTIQLPKNCLFFGVMRKGEVILAGEDIEIWCSDRIMALAMNPLIVPALKVTSSRTHQVAWFPVKSSIKREINSLTLPIHSLACTA